LAATGESTQSVFIAVSKVSFLSRTSSSSTAGREARIQRRTLSPVASHVLCVPSMGTL
jgi:hypothetical protein